MLSVVARLTLRPNFFRCAASSPLQHTPAWCRSYLGANHPHRAHTGYFIEYHGHTSPMQTRKSGNSNAERGGMARLPCRVSTAQHVPRSIGHVQRALTGMAGHLIDHSQSTAKEENSVSLWGRRGADWAVQQATQQCRYQPSAARGKLATSPTAQTFGTEARRCWSTTMCPASISSCPSNSSVFGVAPIPATTSAAGTVLVSAPPSLSTTSWKLSVSGAALRVPQKKYSRLSLTILPFSLDYCLRGVLLTWCVVLHDF